MIGLASPKPAAGLHRLAEGAGRKEEKTCRRSGHRHRRLRRARRRLAGWSGDEGQPRRSPRLAAGRIPRPRRWQAPFVPASSSSPPEAPRPHFLPIAFTAARHRPFGIFKNFYGQATAGRLLERCRHKRASSPVVTDAGSSLKTRCFRTASTSARRTEPESMPGHRRPTVVAWPQSGAAARVQCGPWARVGGCGFAPPPAAHHRLLTYSVGV